MDLHTETSRKNGTEWFLYDGKNIGKLLLNFWQWSGSDLLNNAMRGKLAEYIVALALWLDNDFRIEWDEYDLVYKNLKIEIKSSAYIQSWEQEKYSQIIFWIRPTKDETRTESKRQADIYIFCLLKEKNAKIINPLDMSQWDFFLLSTKELDEKLWSQKTLSLKSLEKLNPQKCNFWNLKDTIDLAPHLL